jgi:hypothetical protein
VGHSLLCRLAESLRAARLSTNLARTSVLSAYSGQLYRLTTCPPLLGPPRPRFQRGALGRARQDLRPTWPVILLRDSRRPPARCGDFRPILGRDLRGVERSRRSLCQTHLLICRSFTGATGLEPTTSGVTGRSWRLRAERGLAGICGVSRAFRPLALRGLPGIRLSFRRLPAGSARDGDTESDTVSLSSEDRAELVPTCPPAVASNVRGRGSDRERRGFDPRRHHIEIQRYVGRRSCEQMRSPSHRSCCSGFHSRSMTRSR